MYVLSKFKDTIRVAPELLGIPIEEVLADELNKRLANKVVLNVGLIICLNDIVEIGESTIYNGDGAIHTKCIYRMVVFRPAVGEIICGTLRSSSKEGLSVSLGFFDSITIPPQNLAEPSHFNETDQAWTWIYQDEEQSQAMALEVGEQIRFRVTSEKFVDVSPQGPLNGPIPSKVTMTNKAEPYTIIGSISESGLGLTKWWK